jgi:HEAT repeat protein
MRSWLYRVALGAVFFIGPPVLILWGFRPLPNRADRLLDEIRILEIKGAGGVPRLKYFITAEPRFWERRPGDYADVRRLAIRRAASEGLRQCIPEVTEALSDSLAYVREEAARFFAVLPTPGVRTLLAVMLREDQNSDVRAEVATALGSLKDPSVVPDLLEATRDPDPEVRMAAAGVLAAFDTPGTVDRLLEMLRDEDEWVQASVALVLAHKGIREHALVSTCRKLATSEHKNVRYMVRGALRKSGHETTSELLWEIRHGDSETRSMAALELVGTSDDRVTTELRKMLKDADQLVRASAALALISDGARDSEVEHMAEISANSADGVARLRGIKALKILGRDVSKFLEVDRDKSRGHRGF